MFDEFINALNLILKTPDSDGNIADLNISKVAQESFHYPFLICDRFSEAWNPPQGTNPIVTFEASIHIIDQSGSFDGINEIKNKIIQTFNEQPSKIQAKISQYQIMNLFITGVEGSSEKSAKDYYQKIEIRFKLAYQDKVNTLYQPT